MSPDLRALGPADDARVELDKLLRTPHKDGARRISIMSQETPSPAGCKLSPQLAAARRPQQSPPVASSPRTRSRRPRTRSRLTASPAAAQPFEFTLPAESEVQCLTLGPQAEQAACLLQAVARGRAARTCAASSRQRATKKTLVAARRLAGLLLAVAHGRAVRAARCALLEAALVLQAWLRGQAARALLVSTAEHRSYEPYEPQERYEPCEASTSTLSTISGAAVRASASCRWPWRSQ